MIQQEQELEIGRLVLRRQDLIRQIAASKASLENHASPLLNTVKVLLGKDDGIPDAAIVEMDKLVTDWGRIRSRITDLQQLQAELQKVNEYLSAFGI